CDTANRQRIPCGENLVVQSGTHASRTRGRKFRARPREARLGFIRRDAKRLGYVGEWNGDDGIPRLALEIRSTVEAEVRRGDGKFIGVEQSANFVALPDVELAFLVFGIGIERRVKSAGWRCHLAQ